MVGNGNNKKSMAYIGNLVSFLKLALNMIEKMHCLITLIHPI